MKLFLDHDFSLTDLFRKNDKLLTLYMNEFRGVNPFRFISMELVDLFRRIISREFHQIHYEQFIRILFNQKSAICSMSMQHFRHRILRLNITQMMDIMVEQRSVVDHDVIVQHRRVIKMKVFDPMVNISLHRHIQYSIIDIFFFSVH